MPKAFDYTIFLYLRHNECKLGKHSSVDVCHGFRNLVLAMAVATLWMVMLGGEAENLSPEPNLSPLPPQHTVFSKTLHLKPLRQLSCFLLGSITLYFARLQLAFFTQGQ